MEDTSAQSPIGRAPGLKTPEVAGSNPAGRACRKCGGRIPWQARIEGVVRHLINRKFCITCSPFKKHNTKTDDPARPARGPTYGSWTRERKKESANSVYRRGKRIRAELIRAAGGQCCKCGYKRCQDALEFHHKDPSTKLFNISSMNARRYTLEAVLTEVAKCELVCANCHREIEAGLII